jgi:hypothetical protein
MVRSLCSCMVCWGLGRFTSWHGFTLNSKHVCPSKTKATRGDLLFRFFFFFLHFNVTHSNFPCCKLLEQFLVVIAWNYKFLFWVVVSLVVALVGSLGIEYIELWNKIAFVVVVVVSFFFFFSYNIIQVDITFSFTT